MVPSARPEVARGARARKTTSAGVPECRSAGAPERRRQHRRFLSSLPRRASDHHPLVYLRAMARAR
eukprot:2644828-Prymnesium_polylepis.1